MIRFNGPRLKKIGSWFSTRSDTNRAVYPEEMASRGLKCRDCTIYTEKTKTLNIYLVNVQCCFCIYDKTTRGSQEVALVFKDTVYVHDINL